MDPREGWGGGMEGEGGGEREREKRKRPVKGTGYSSKSFSSKCSGSL